MNSQYLLIKTTVALLLGAVAMGCGGIDTAGHPTTNDARLASATSDLISKYKLPAMAGAVVTPTSIRVGVSGVQKVGGSLRVSTDSLWHLGSNAKALNSALVAKLVERGTIKWSTTLGSVFPELSSTARPQTLALTVEQLLLMRAGLPALQVQTEILLVPKFQGSERQQRFEFVKWATQQAPEANPGEFLYSNSNNPVVAAMLEKVTGEDWFKLLKREILAPMGMNNVVYGWPAQSGSDQPWGHLYETTAGIHVPLNPDIPENQLPAYLVPSGGLSMTATDYARFLQESLNGLKGKNGVLLASSVQRIFSPSLGGTYAMGWEAVEFEGRRVYSFTGSLELFNSQAAIDPTNSRAALCFTNGGASEPVFNAILEGTQTFN
ncbi:MAG: serine hydrolase domain-containing protein [Armatimonadota bacterium]